MSTPAEVFDPEIDELIGPAANGAQMDGGYDGASRIDRSMASWFPPLMSADASIIPDKPLMDARSRDLMRNDGYVQSGATIRKDSIVGSMYMLNSRPEAKVLGLDETWADEFQEEIETKFALAMESPECYIHAGRKMTFTDIVRLAVGMDTVGGEFLATAEWLRGQGRPFSTAIQVVSLDRLSTPWDRMAEEGPRLRGGVRMNMWGEPIGYYIQNAHPSDWDAGADAFRWKYVPARKPWGRRQVLHVFENSDPEQTRGVSDMVAALKEIRITKRFRDVTLQNAVLQATYAASIESDLPSEAVYNAMGAGNGDAGQVGQAIRQYATQYLSAIQEYMGNSRNIHLDGVKIPHFFPGTKLNLQPVNSSGNVGSDFEKSLLRYVSANLGVSYEELSKDYSNANYSNLKASLASTRRTMASKKRRTADRTATMIFRLWFEEMMNKGQIESLPRNAPNMYEGMNMEAYTACEWIGASLGQIDELKETQAAVLRMKYNLSTEQDEAARLGRDWRRLHVQAERERKDREAKGIEWKESNAMNAASGEPSDGQDPDEESGSNQQGATVHD